MKWSTLFVLCTLYVGHADPAINDNIPDESLRKDFTILVNAIRKVENGGHGREYGIMDKRASTPDLQRRWCAATCWKNWLRWQKTDQKKPYLVFLRDRYAPIGAENDPENLNENWLPNLVAMLEKGEQR